MKTQLLAIAGLALVLTACSSAPIQPSLASFTDIPTPEGMSYQPERSGVSEGPNVNVARLVYRGRSEVESTASVMRQGLEQNGWKLIRTTTTTNRTIAMTFQKPGSDLVVSLWEAGWGGYYTYMDVTVGRVVTAPSTGSAAWTPPR
jgi:hypothetical protein